MKVAESMMISCINDLCRLLRSSPREDASVILAKYEELRTFDGHISAALEGAKAQKEDAYRHWSERETSNVSEHLTYSIMVSENRVPIACLHRLRGKLQEMNRFDFATRMEMTQKESFQLAEKYEVVTNEYENMAGKCGMTETEKEVSTKMREVAKGLRESAVAHRDAVTRFTQWSDLNDVYGAVRKRYEEALAEMKGWLEEGECDIDLNEGGEDGESEERWFDAMEEIGSVNEDVDMIGERDMVGDMVDGMERIHEAW